MKASLIAASCKCRLHSCPEQIAIDRSAVNKAALNLLNGERRAAQLKPFDVHQTGALFVIVF